MKPRQIAVAIVLAGLVAVIYLAMQPLVRTRQTALCQTNLKQIRQAAWIYIRDYDEKSLLARNWTDALQPYVVGFGPNKRSPTQIEHLFCCPTTGNDYAYNQEIAGISMAKLPLATPLFFETKANGPRPNLSGNGNLWPLAPAHESRGQRGSNVLFYDGHVKMLNVKPVFGSFSKPIPTPRTSKS